MMLTTLLVSLALTQARPDAGTRHAGKDVIKDASSNVKVSMLADGGVASVTAESPPAPALASGPSLAEFEALRSKVIALESRATNLEKKSAQIDHLAAELEKIATQFVELKRQTAENEQQRAEVDRQTAERRARADQAVTAIGDAQRQLATGSDNIEWALSAAEQAFTGQALNYVRSARVSIANRDLASARVWLSLAVIEAQNTR